MPITRNPFDIQAIAIAMRDRRTGQMMLWGSRQVYDVVIDMRQEYREMCAPGDRYLSYLPTHQSFRIAAECGSLQMHHSEPMAEQPHLTQRGIYLPDMSFRALPAPSEEERGVLQCGRSAMPQPI